ncbi:unnamed protein product [Prorocentrum cordatum]|uniref:Uncharacterized protein n=1 Tax=Prorocentrum cordatum TaxID=2364126 RepID=A0ABN9SCW4_9DINO|nr:unnamed protein product [Polarella glacialis]
MDDGVPIVEMHDIATPDTPADAFAAARPPAFEEIAKSLRQEVRPPRTAIVKLESRFGQFEGAFGSQMKSVEERVSSMEERIEETDMRITNIERHVDAQDTHRPDLSAKELWDQIKALKVEVSMLKFARPVNSASSEVAKTLVIGGLQTLAP